ncbi:hypothetical protein DHODJN_20970 [Methylorubrum extorquens]
MSATAQLPLQIFEMVENLIDVWPDAVYSKALVETRLLGRTTVFITDPQLIRSLLVDHADALEPCPAVLRQDGGSSVGR